MPAPSLQPTAQTQLPECVAAPRERILQTAHRLFYAEGIRATGIDRIIAEARVTKVTFYRHFASKDLLVLAFLAYRHALWMRWFTEALHRHRSRQTRLQRRRAPLQPVHAALAEWFANPEFRGCAFINSVGEFGSSHPEIIAIAASHKQDMTAAIALLIADRPGSAEVARAAGIVADGAIIRAQTGADGIQEALEALALVLQALGTAAA